MADCTEKSYKVKIDGNEIKILSGHDRVLASSKGQDLEKDKRLAVEAGKANCSWCKKEVAYPEVGVQIFE